MWWNGVHKVPSCGKFRSSPRWRDARKVRRNVGTTRSRCIFIPDGADAADESGYVGSLLPSFVYPTLSRRRSLTAARGDSVSPTTFPSHPPDAVIFSASLPLFRPQSQFYFGPSEEGIFRHTGIRPNAVIHHPRRNTPYNVLCRMVNPSPILMLLPKQPPSLSSRRLHYAGLHSTKGGFLRGYELFSLRESPIEI